MKNITINMIREEGFEIIEEINDCLVYAPIDFDSIAGGDLSDIKNINFYVDKNEQEIETMNSMVLYSIKKDGRDLYKEGSEIETYSYLSIDEVIAFFENYFKNHTTDESKLKTSDILRRENIFIEEYKTKIRSDSIVDIDTISDDFVENHYLTKKEEYDDGDAEFRYSVYKGYDCVLDKVSAKEVDKYIKSIVDKYRQNLTTNA